MEWAGWCQVDCVLDPEKLFSDPGYLMEVAVGDDSDDDGQPLAAAGPGGLRRADPRRGQGGARARRLSRLLNLTDGLLGQGRDVLVAVTTNEDLARLHPAVVRPGRCLAQIEADRMPAVEAAAWLGSSAGIGPSGATLAELFAMRSGRAPTVPAPAETTGLYL